MRRGIGLRGYAQQDPLNEFRKEAYALYGELRDLIRHQVARGIFRVSVQRQAPQPMPMPTPEATAAAAAGAAAGGARAGATMTSTAGSTTSTGSGGGGSTSTAGGRATVSGPLAKGLPGGGTARQMRESLGDRTSTPASGPREGYTPSGQRIGRNDPCWCGSGQRYKRCHGA